MTMWLSILGLVAVGGFALRMAYQRARLRRIAARRRIEQPNSHYSSLGVRNQVDRERWGDINLGGLHPLNQEEVNRLLYVVDVDGIHALSGKDRLFLDNMTLRRLAH